MYDQRSVMQSYQEYVFQGVPRSKRIEARMLMLGGVGPMVALLHVEPDVEEVPSSEQQPKVQSIRCARLFHLLCRLLGISGSCKGDWITQMLGV